MPTARRGSAVVHIPGNGDLVLGGLGISGKILRTAELFLKRKFSVGNSRSWQEIEPMIKPRNCPSGVYFNSRVIVISPFETTPEMLSIRPGQKPQWTLLSCPPRLSWYPKSMCIFEGKILVSG